MIPLPSVIYVIAKDGLMFHVIRVRCYNVLVFNLGCLRTMTHDILPAVDGTSDYPISQSMLRERYGFQLPSLAEHRKKQRNDIKKFT